MPKKTPAKTKKATAKAPKSKSAASKTAAAKPVTEKALAPKAAPKIILATEVNAPAVKKPKAPVTGNYFYANGKRKTSIATVRLITAGKGTITINNRTFENYFPVGTDQDKVLSPFRLTNTMNIFDVSVRVKGGGIHSQAEAVRHGIAKALLAYNIEHRAALKHIGFLTRDSRIKERKKYGLKRARRAPQWQKR